MPQASRGKTKAGLDSAEAPEVFSAFIESGSSEDASGIGHRKRCHVLFHTRRLKVGWHQLRPVGLRVPVELDIQTQSREDGRLSGSLPSQRARNVAQAARGPTSNQSPSGSSACSWAWANQDAALALGGWGRGGLSGRKERAVLPGPRGRGTLPRGPEREEVWCTAGLPLCGRRGLGRSARRGCRPRRKSFRRI